MLFLVLLAVGVATAVPVPNVYILTEPTPLRNYLLVEPIPEAPGFPLLHYGIASKDKKQFEEGVLAVRNAPEEDDAHNAKPEGLDAIDAIPSEHDANNAKPEEVDAVDAIPSEDDANNGKLEDDDADAANPQASEHDEEQSDEIKTSPPSKQEFKPLVIKLDDPNPPAVSWLPSFIPAFQFPSLNFPSLPSLSSLNLPSLSNLPSISNWNLPGLSSLSLPSISNFNLSNLSNYNIPGLSSIFGSSPSGSRYIVYRSD